jgi:hypothetical protein
VAVPIDLTHVAVDHGCPPVPERRVRDSPISSLLPKCTVVCVRCVYPCLGFSASGIVPKASANPGVDASPVARTQGGMAQDRGLPCARLPGEGNALPTVALLQVPYELDRSRHRRCVRRCFDSTAEERQVSQIAGLEHRLLTGAIARLGLIGHGQRKTVPVSGCLKK